MTLSPTLPATASDPQQLVEVQLILGYAEAEIFAEALMQYGALAVGFEDAQANTEQEQALFGEPGFEDEQFLWNLNRVNILFRNVYEARAIVQEAATQVAQDQPSLAAAMQAFTKAENLSYTAVPEQDWVRLTQSQFNPIVIHPKLTITPSWHPTPSAANNAAVNHAAVKNAAVNKPTSNIQPEPIYMVLDPGLAFGTGSHPTTALCLRWLCEHSLQHKTVLDYGCGSGILAIAAMQLGAAHTLAVDIDPQALSSTQANAHNNDVLVATALPDAVSTQEPSDVVVANILSGPLKVLAPLLCSKVKAQGMLVLSGILARQAQELIACYAPWLPMQLWAEHEGWVCLVGQKP
jgi:ribosomal protein L11 methyltransferase